MKYPLEVILSQQILLMVLSSTNRVDNSALATAGVGFPPCVKGEMFYSRGRCKRCPCKKKAANYMSYNLTFSEEYEALECYPCYCKLGRKSFDTHSKRCVKCPLYINGKLNINANITVDEWHGAMICYPCICNTGFFGNALTHYQCVDCMKCQKQNREEIVPCTQDIDAQCGDCLDGYRKVNNVACVKIKTTTKESVNPFISDMSTTTKVPQKTSHVDHGSSTQKSEIIIVVILIIVVLIAGAILYICWYIKKNLPCRNSYDVSTLSSKISLSKTEDERKMDTTSPLLNGGSDIEHDAVTDNINTESNRAECASENNQPESSNNDKQKVFFQNCQFGSGNIMYAKKLSHQNNLSNQNNP